MVPPRYVSSLSRFPPRGPSLTAADADGGSGTVLLMPTPWLPGPSNQAGSEFTKARHDGPIAV